MRNNLPALAFFVLVVSGTARAEEPRYRDIFPDTWVATDGLGRTMPDCSVVGPVIFCALLEFVGKRMNEDGALPWARTKGLWDCLYESGVVRRSFNAKRFAWIRRMLSGMGLVEVQDPTYVIGERAAKWCPSGKFWELASSLDHKDGEEGQDFTETAPAIDPQECWERGVPLVPIGVQAKESAERRRIDELVEAIVGPCNWTLAA